MFRPFCPVWHGKVTSSWGFCLGLKMPDFAPYDAAPGNRVDDVAAICLGVLLGPGWPCAGRVHQMRPDLGRLAAIAKILQIGPFL